MGKSNISYLDWVWNPYSQNCDKVSEGCKHCYAETMRERFGETFRGAPQWIEKRVEEVAKIPSGVVCGVNFLSDTWHEKAQIGWIDRIHALIRQRSDVIFVYTTKRAHRFLNDGLQIAWPDNLFVGVSVELPKYLNRIRHLAALPARHKWISFEPLLGDMGIIDLTGIEWVVTGGESGEGHRKMAETWAMSIGQQCDRRHVAWYHKQGNHLFPDRNQTIFGGIYRDFPQSIVDIRKRETFTQGTLF